MIKYLYFLITARHLKGYGLHSPFMFQLYHKVIAQKNNDTLLVIRKFVRYLKTNPKPVYCVTDKGAGSKYGNSSYIKLNKLVKRSSLPHRYGKILYYLVNHFQPTYILELGTSVGVSTLYLAMAGNHSKVWTIESSADKLGVADENMETLGIQNVYLYQGKFAEELPKILNQMPSVDMVFIDGDHNGENTLEYYDMILGYIHNDTILVIDDIHWSESMESAWEEIRYDEDVRVSIDLFRMGIVFFKKELSCQSFKIWY